MEKKKLKVVLAHPDQQHSFKTAVALQEAGMLDKYITTVYNKPKSLTNFFEKIVKGKYKTKLKQHFSKEIEDCKVKQFCQLFSLILPVVFRIDSRKIIFTKLENLRNYLFSRKVAGYCIKNDIDVLIAFDTVSSYTFKLLDKYSSRTKKIIDMSAPYRPYMKKVFEEEALKNEGKSILPEIVNSYRYKNWLKHSEVEFELADAYLVASDFTAKSLMAYGADKNKIYKCLYGIDTSFFNSEGRKKLAKEDRLECVFVGNINEQKGILYFLEAASRLGKKDYKFTLVGAYDKNNPILMKYDGVCSYTGHIVKSELVELLKKSDVIVFPSLADGFGFAVLEAMACGVIPICSKNAGVSCLVEDKQNGFLINAGNSDEIYESIYHINNNRNDIDKLSENAVKTASKLTWDSYYNDVVTAVCNFAEME